jgi:hypothetical protein
MYFRKLSSLVLAAFTPIALVEPSVSSDQARHDRQAVAAPVHPQVADGGAPVPPVPPIKKASVLVADGGAPVPPVPTPIPPGFAKSHYTILADGGAPVPPVPHKPSLKTFVADGGAPVPPVPQIKNSNALVADGGAPVPPVPPVPKPPMTTFVAV